ncbi:MAG: hypothetical protein OXI05_04545 [Bacteroidota bacterium]|nr:hypothetical protein [Bacteroidota bacterium]
MQLEWPAAAQKTDSIFVLPLPGQPHSRPWTSDVPRDPLMSSVSLAASPDIVELQKKRAVIEQKLQSTWAMADQGDAIQALSHLRKLLYASFEAEPLEDGIDHPAEDIIGDAIRSTDNTRVFNWLSRACLDAEHPTFSASILRCLGRLMPPGTELWRVELVWNALTVNDAEIRDAALQTAEFWGGLGMRYILEIKVQTEPLRWLRNYMRDVIEDLR